MNSFLLQLAAIKNNPLVWAQAVHFLIGLCTLLLCYRAGERRRFWIPYLLLGVGALILEGWFDPRYEHDPFWSLKGGLLDLISYLVGGGTGYLIDRLDQGVKLTHRRKREIMALLDPITTALTNLKASVDALAARIVAGTATPAEVQAAADQVTAIQAQVDALSK